MRDRNEPDLAARQSRASSDEEQTAELLPAVARFVRAAESEVDERLTADDVEARLQGVLGRAAAEAPPQVWSVGNPHWRGAAARLAEHGYPIVEVWLRAILASDQEIDLTRDDLDELAQRTVALAINRVRDDLVSKGIPAAEVADLDLREQFLVQCVRQLPAAYRGLLLSAGRLPDWDELEELSGLQREAVHLAIVDALWHCVTAGREDTLHRVGHHDERVEEIMARTRAAIRNARATEL